MLPCYTNGMKEIVQEMITELQRALKDKTLTK